MKTITKTLAVLGLGAISLAGCAESNEGINSKDPTGKPTAGVTPANAPKTSADFMKANPSAMQKDKKAEEKYKEATGQTK